MSGPGGCPWAAEIHLQPGSAWCSDKVFHATAQDLQIFRGPGTGQGLDGQSCSEPTPPRQERSPWATHQQHGRMAWYSVFFWKGQTEHLCAWVMGQSSPFRRQGEGVAHVGATAASWGLYPPLKILGSAISRELRGVWGFCYFYLLNLVEAKLDLFHIRQISFQGPFFTNQVSTYHKPKKSEYSVARLSYLLLAYLLFGKAFQYVLWTLLGNFLNLRRTEGNFEIDSWVHLTSCISGNLKLRSI